MTAQGARSDIPAPIPIEAQIFPAKHGPFQTVLLDLGGLPDKILQDNPSLKKLPVLVGEYALVVRTSDLRLVAERLLRDLFRTLSICPEHNPPEYRQQLLDGLLTMNATYDKLLVTLAGATLAFSITFLTFLKEVLGFESDQMPILLPVAWMLLISSLAFVLGRLLFGIEAYRLAVKQVDRKSMLGICASRKLRRQSSRSFPPDRRIRKTIRGTNNRGTRTIR